MVLYKCKCGEELPVSENTEKSRDVKRAWKKQHRSTAKKLNPVDFARECDKEVK